LEQPSTLNTLLKCIKGNYCIIKPPAQDGMMTDN
jgi:hypothetical protein